MEDFREKCEELRTVCFEGEVTVKKTELWLVMAVCLLMGILYGLRKAPMTHGLMVGCNNGNNSGNSGGSVANGAKQNSGGGAQENTGKNSCRGSKKARRKKACGRRR